MDSELPISGPEARRRLMAAIGLSAEVTSIQQLGEVSGFREAVWKSIGRDPEDKTRRFLPRHALVAAKALRVPYEWFTVADLAEAVRLGAVVAAETAATREAIAAQMTQRTADAADRREQQHPDTGEPSTGDQDHPHEAT